MDREAWHAALHGVAKSRTRLSDWTELNSTDTTQWLNISICYINDHNDKSSYLLSPDKDVKVILTVHFICVTYLFYNWKSVTLNLPHLFHWSQHSPPALWQPRLFSGIHKSVSVLLCLFLFCLLASTYKWSLMVFVFSVWFISFSVIPSRSIHIVTDGKILFFYGWVIFHLSLYNTHTHTHTHTYISLFLYPFI